jgi:hypothetical protein
MIYCISLLLLGIIIGKLFYKGVAAPDKVNNSILSSIIIVFAFFISPFKGSYALWE